MYNVIVEGFDIKDGDKFLNYAETSKKVTVFRLPCTNPVVFLPQNQTDFSKKFDMPTYFKSIPFQIEATVQMTCTEKMPTL